MTTSICVLRSLVKDPEDSPARPRAAAPHGLATTTGSTGAVGWAGLALGGGYGPLSGRCGLALDNILGAELVLADGALVTVDAKRYSVSRSIASRTPLIATIAPPPLPLHYLVRPVRHRTLPLRIGASIG